MPMDCVAHGVLSAMGLAESHSQRVFPAGSWGFPTVTAAVSDQHCCPLLFTSADGPGITQDRSGGSF